MNVANFSITRVVELLAASSTTMSMTSASGISTCQPWPRSRSSGAADTLPASASSAKAEDKIRRFCTFTTILPSRGHDSTTVRHDRAKACFYATTRPSPVFLTGKDVPSATSAQPRRDDTPVKTYLMDREGQGKVEQMALLRQEMPISANRHRSDVPQTHTVDSRSPDAHTTFHVRAFSTSHRPVQGDRRASRG